MTVSGKYDPSHPDADWSGYVAFVSKKHVEAPPCQLKTNDTGIAPDEGAKTSEWKMGRRVIDRSKGGSTFELIGGPEEINPNQWQSEAQSLTSKKKATIDQLTETGRSMHVCGKKSSVPAYENVSPFTDSVASRLRDENPYSLNENSSSNTCRSKAPHEHVNGKENLIGYRAPRAGNSFLAGLGKKLATDRL